MPRIPIGPIIILAGFILFVSTSFLFSQRIPVAVLDFEANGISQTEVIALTDRLRNELFRQGNFDVVERGLMEGILLEQDFQLSGCTTDECLVEVGQLIGARQIIGGRISRINDFFTVSARVVDVETGKLLVVPDYDLRGGFEEMLTVGMAQIAARLSDSSVDDDLPAIVRIDQTTPDAAQRPTAPSSSAASHFQIAYALPRRNFTGSDVRVSWYPKWQSQIGPLTLLPALTGGKYSVEGEAVDSPVDGGSLRTNSPMRGTDLVYFLLGADVIFPIGKIGLGVNIGAGYASGEDWRDPLNIGELALVNVNDDVSGMVFSAGINFSYKISRFKFFLEPSAFEGKTALGGSVFRAGVQF